MFVSKRKYEEVVAERDEAERREKAVMQTVERLLSDLASGKVAI